MTGLGEGRGGGAVEALFLVQVMALCGKEADYSVCLPLPSGPYSVPLSAHPSVRPSSVRPFFFVCV